MYDGSSLLREAESIYDGSPLLKAHADSLAWRNGFSLGAGWMRQAMEEVRGQRLPETHNSFTGLGLAKYTFASLAALAVLTLAWMLHPALSISAISAFYAVEVQWVFLFPMALDGSKNPWRDSRSLMRRHAGTVAAMSLVLPFAWRMLSGGFLGRGFVRSWCTGCLAVVLWYERCQKALVATPELGRVPRLEVGRRAPLFVRSEQLRLSFARPIRILLLTDMHARKRHCERLFEAIDETIAMMSPHLIILGGDLADSAAGLLKLASRIQQWVNRGPVLAIPGNHDVWLGRDRVREAVVQAGAHWLPDAAYLFKQDGENGLWIADVGQWGDPPDGLTSVAVLHDPADCLKAEAHSAAVVLAGHLHGCQMVLGEQDGRLLPGAWFYRWNVLRRTIGNGELIVSRGCADTLPVRWNCPREVIVIDLCS